MQRPAPWWTSALVRWHIRHVGMLWVGTRVLLMFAFAFSSAFAPRGSQVESLVTLMVSPTAALVSFLVVMSADEIDRRRIGAPLLFANLGYSPRWSAITTGAIAIACEVLLQVAMRAWGGAR